MEHITTENYGPWALIAGGSEGIGLAFAEVLAARGFNLILLARREDPLQQARAALQTQYGVEVITHSVDLAGTALESQLDALVGELEIGLLIYNAGATHGLGLFLDNSLESAQTLVRLNCHGPLLFCHRLARPMVARGRGGIILLSSLSGLAGGGYIATYSATKSFDIGLAEGLWAELKPRGVDVLALIAGATDTPAVISSGANFSDETAQPMRSVDVATEGLTQLGAGPVHIAGADNRAAGEFLRGPAREDPVQMMTAGGAILYGMPYPIEAPATDD